MVLAAEGDGVLRPVEIGWHGLVNGEDLSALSLALPSGHVCRRPVEDEEHILAVAATLINHFAGAVSHHLQFLVLLLPFRIRQKIEERKLHR